MRITFPVMIHHLFVKIRNRIQTVCNQIKPDCLTDLKFASVIHLLTFFLESFISIFQNKTPLNSVVQKAFS